MPEYRAPLEEMNFVIDQLHDLPGLATAIDNEDANAELLAAVLTESDKLANQVWSPLNWPGDQQGVQLTDAGVKVADGFTDAYKQYAEGGWNSLCFDPEYGGQGLPFSFSMPVAEMAQAANMSLGLCPLLTTGAIEAITAHASEALKATYLEKMIAGEWTGTMNLTEPHAGTDLALLKSTATPADDHYLIKGQKIFITWGDHDMTENIVHLVLARLPDAPAGVKGISLFLVPKFLVNEDGSLGQRNDVYALNVEHKMGIHASPTCVMSYGDNGGAIGYLVGEPHAGLAAMFTMMNNARLVVGLQGVAIADRAYQHAVAYAQERVQCIAPGRSEVGAIIHHPDVRRMLMTMRGLTEAARAICYLNAKHIDLSHHAATPEARSAANKLVGLLTPIAKGWSTEVAQEITYHGVQIHGGMGFVEETGAAQYQRDARILPIYEGTTGIQALDLVGRKTLGDGGAGMATLIAAMRADVSEYGQGLSQLQLDTMVAGIDALEQAYQKLLSESAEDPMLPGAISYDLLMLAGYVCGGWQMMRASALVTSHDNQDFAANKQATSAYYLEHLLPRFKGHLASIEVGSESLMSIAPEAM